MREVNGGHARRRPVPAVLLTALLAAGSLPACDGDGAPAPREVELPVENQTGDVRPEGGVPVEYPRPDSVVSLLLEGDSVEPAVFRLFRSPHRFPVSFSTYLADGLEPVEAGRDTLRFLFQGADPVHGPALEVVALPDGTTGAEARSLARAFVEGGGATVEERSEAGLVATYAGLSPRRSARADLVRDGGRWVVLRAWYPPGSAGVESRLRHVRGGWVWDASGAPLVTPVR